MFNVHCSLIIDHCSLFIGRLSLLLLAGSLGMWTGCMPPDKPPRWMPAVTAAHPEDGASNIADGPTDHASPQVTTSRPPPPVPTGEVRDESPPSIDQPEEVTPQEDSPTPDDSPGQTDPEIAEPETAAPETATDPQLRQAVQTLASTNQDDVLAAQNLLFEKSEAALPLLQQATRAADPIEVAGALEMLRRLDWPEKTLPMMVDVLGSPERSACWPDAIREIGLAGAPGAAAPLLQLALTAESPEQRTAALDALALVPDPPRETAAALLPLLFDDGPALGSALLAAARAVSLHGQHDLLSGRGLDAELSAELLKQLTELPARLSAVMARGDDNPAARAAKRLAIVTRQVSADPLPDVKILAFTGEMKDSPAAALLDGVWNTVDPKLMWRYTADQPGSIVLDLGRERTVAGVRIWNLNESGGGHRGWKDIAVCVGSTPAELAAPVATGIVPQAPGKANLPDFSTTLPVEFARGRYVRLEAQSVWRKDAHAGLTEVQVLGY